MKKLLWAGPAGWLLLTLLTFPAECAATARSGLLFFVNTLFPALFPFAVCANLLTALGAGRKLGRWLGPVMEAGGLPPEAGLTLGLGLLCGYPTGSRTLAAQVQAGELTPCEAARLLPLCQSPNPAFVLGTVANSLLGIPAAGPYLLLCLWLGGLCTAGFLRLFGFRATPGPVRPVRRQGPIPRVAPATALSRAVTDAAGAMLLIAGLTIVFGLLLRSFSLWGLDRFLPPLGRGLAAALFELSQGAVTLAGCDVSLRLKLALLATGIGWGGLCIHAQSAGLLAGSGVSFRYYWPGRLLAALSAGLLAGGLYPLFCLVQGGGK